MHHWAWSKKSPLKTCSKCLNSFNSKPINQIHFFLLKYTFNLFAVLKSINLCFFLCFFCSGIYELLFETAVMHFGLYAINFGLEPLFKQIFGEKKSKKFCINLAERKQLFILGMLKRNLLLGGFPVKQYVFEYWKELRITNICFWQGINQATSV